MTADVSLRLFDLVFELTKDKAKAQEFVSKIEQTIDNKFESQRQIFLTKEDKVDIMRTIYMVGIIQFLAIVGSVSAIISFMLKH